MKYSKIDDGWEKGKTFHLEKAVTKFWCDKKKEKIVTRENEPKQEQYN